MSQYHYLRVYKQKGVKFDQSALAKVQESVADELFAQHEDPQYKNEPIFNLVKGRLKLYDGGHDASWTLGDTVNLWGYDAKNILKDLAKLMTAGEVTFTEEPEGWPVKIWVVTPGKVAKG